jgi:DNA-binding response OmpR family regulator
MTEPRTRLLLIEDDAAIRFAIRDFLERQGYALV